MAHNQKIEMVLADPAASYWLKDALRAAAKRDPLDAYYDAMLLAELLAPPHAADKRKEEVERFGFAGRAPVSVGEWLNQQFYGNKGERIL